MKDEPYVKYKHARCINSRSDRFKVVVGPFIKLIENEVYKLPEFIKHIPVHERPKYIMDMIYKEGAKYGSSDYETFEALFTARLMNAVELPLTRHMLKNVPGGPAVTKVIEKADAGNNVCQNKFFSVVVPATRMSGDMWTSLFNGVTNLIVLKYFGFKACVVEGDDGLFRIDGPLPSAERFKELGLKIKLEIHQDLSTASFCGIIFDPIDMLNICDPLKVLARFGWTTNRYWRARRSTHLTLLRAKAYSYAYQYPGCPIVSALAQYGLRVTRSCDVRRILNSKNTAYWERLMLSKALVDEVLPINPPIKTRLLMERQFSVPVETQILIENYLNSLMVVQELAIPNLDLMVPQEWLDYNQKYYVDLPCVVDFEQGRFSKSLNEF